MNGMSYAIQRRAHALLATALAVTAVLAFSPLAVAQSEICPQYDGFTCDEWVTDTVGVVGDDTRLESTIDRIVERFGHQIAVVVVATTGGDRSVDVCGGSRQCLGRWRPGAR